ncbi:MAG: hypothetical protein AAGI38_00785 [Bacteroidota bacterium]
MSGSIQIANPLYDVVFRYMMDDQRVARLVLTAILGEQVLDLDFYSTEQSLKLGEAQITVTRMDFRARIQQEDGTEKMVLIELQKAKLYQQIGRFRRYLGQQYQRNPHTEKDDSSSPLPILPIYILGEPYSQNGIPVVRVSRNSYDASTGEKIDEKHPFIEALTHDAIVIQTRYLTGKRRTDLERFLSIFDQSNISDTKGHILKFNEADYPEGYQPVIRRLQQALADPDLEEKMELEDEVLQEFQKKEEEIAHMRALSARQQQQIADERKQKEEERKQKEDAQKQLVQLLANQGNSAESIAEITGLSEELIKRLMEN